MVKSYIKFAAELSSDPEMSHFVVSEVILTVTYCDSTWMNKTFKSSARMEEF